MRTRTSLASAAAVCVLTLLAGCGDDPSDTAGEPAASEPAAEEATAAPSESRSASPPESTGAEEDVLTIEEFMYRETGPVAPGTEITVENTDAEVHTVTAAGGGGFDLTIPPGRSRTLTAPEQPGRYAYLCSFHAGMTAALVVR